MDWTLFEPLRTVFFGSPAYLWALSVLVLAGACLALVGLRKWMVRRMAVVPDHATSALHDLLGDLLARTKSWFLLVLAARIAAVLLTLPADAAHALRVATVLSTVVQGGIWADRAARFWSQRLLLGRAGSDASRATMATLSGVIGRVVVWTLALVLVLQNLGIQVTALLAGLGVGGIAIALALQHVLVDVFASLSITLDRPFVTGDFIVVDEMRGTVEHVGLKTTRIRSQGGELLVFSNSDLLGSRIRNFGTMNERRVEFRLGIAYETPLATVARLPGLLREIVQAVPDTRFDRAHFMSYGDFSLIFEIVYFVMKPDYNLHMDIQQAINLKIFEVFARDEIEFAYPTQTVVVRESKTSQNIA